MEPGVHFDPSKTSPHAASYAAQRNLYADSSLQDLEVEECDMPDAYPRDKTDTNYTNYLGRPKRSDGTYTHPVCHYEICMCRKVRLMLATDGKSTVTALLSKKGGRWFPVRPGPSLLKKPAPTPSYSAPPAIFLSAAIPPPFSIASAASFSSHGIPLSNPLLNNTQELPSTS